MNLTYQGGPVENSRGRPGNMERPHKHSIRLAWIATYLILISVPIILSCVVYASTTSLLASQLDESNAALVELLGKEIDGKLESAKRLVYDITWNQYLAFLMGRNDLSDPAVRFDLWKLSADLDLYRAYAPVCEAVFIYFPKMDQVLTPQGFYPLESFQRFRFDGGDMDLSRLRNTLEQRHAGDSLPIPWIDDGGRPGRRAVYLRTLPGGLRSQSVAVVGVVFDTEAVIESLRSVVKQVKADTVITNDQGTILVSTLDTTAGQPPLLVPASSGIREQTIGNTTFKVLSRKTQNLGWAVQLLIPADVLEARLRFSRGLIIAGIVFSLAFSSVVALLLFRRNYRPLARTVQSVLQASGQQIRGRDDEYGIIQDAVTQVSAMKQLAEDRFEKNKQALAEQAVYRLTRGRLPAGLPFEETRAALDMDFPTDRFMVMVFDVAYDGIDFGAAQEAAFNELALALSGTLRLYRSSEANCLECLGALENGPFDPNGFKLLVEQACASLSENRGLLVNCAFSSVVEGLQQIPVAYTQAQEAREYRLVTGGAEPLEYQEILDMRGGIACHFDLRDEVRLLGAIRSAQLSECEEIIDGVTSQIGVGGTSPASARFLAWDLGAAIMKAIAELGSDDSETAGLVEEVAAVLQRKSLPEVRAGLKRVLGKLCGLAETRLKEKQVLQKSQATQDLIARILAFMQDNHADHNLNISRIAIEFKLTPAYLSRIFRECQPNGILDHLNGLRVERAKLLLAQKNRTLSQVCSESGFASVNTFLRVFKKSTGVSPGKFCQ